MIRPVVFSDLDDTIFQTARKMQEVPDPDLLASVALNGSHSYMSQTQTVMMDWLLASTRFIPVTARSTEALARCRVPFRDYRVCTNGAVILLPDGTPDADWLSKTRREAEDVRESLEGLLAFVQSETRTGLYRSWIVEEFGDGFYFCVKSNDGAGALDAIEADLAAIAGDRLVRHRNDNNLSYTPAGISKRHAVEHLSARLLSDANVPLFGMGDSLTDLPFMSLCDMMVIPRGSQIDRDVLRSGGL